MRAFLLKYNTVQEIADVFLKDFENCAYETTFNVKFIFHKEGSDIVKITGIKNDFIKCDYNISENLIRGFQNPKAVLSYIMNDMIEKLERRYYCHINDIGEE